MKNSLNQRKDETAKKTYRLGESSQTQLNAIMDEYGIKTENEAIKYVLEQHMQMATNNRFLSRKLEEAENTVEEQRLIVGNFIDASREMTNYFINPLKDEEE